MVKRYKSAKKLGLPPGSPVHIGLKEEKVTGSIFCYNDQTYREGELNELEQKEYYKAENVTCAENVTWININGVHQLDIIEKISEKINLHPLILEDIMNTEQRIKVEEYEDYLFVVLKMLKYDANQGTIETEQISLVAGGNFVISFQEKEGDVFDSIRERIRKGKGQLRRQKADYLMYCLIDAIVDHYLIILDELVEKTDLLEEKILDEVTKEILEEIHRLKSRVIMLHRISNPLGVIINYLAQGSTQLITNTTAIYLRDVHDHLMRIVDKSESMRELLNNLLNLYLSLSSHKMNEVMKILTIIATIFMPMTFIAGIYGMNFQYMPELELRWGYPAIIIVMAIIAVVMLIFFKRKKML